MAFPIRRRSLKQVATLLTLPLVLTLAACDRSSTSPEPHGAPASLELLDRSTGERVAYVHGDHWHGSISIEAGEEIALNARFLDVDDREIPLGGEYTVRTELASGSAQGVVALSDHGDHVDLEGVAEGQVQVHFLLWHVNHEDWRSPALTITVQAGEPGPGDPDDVARVELYDRDSGEQLAHTHGTGASMHWDGELPHLHSGEELEVNVVFKDSRGWIVPLGGEYTVQARLTGASPAGVVSLSNHGDHVDIDALAPGEVEIIFALWHDDHSEFDAPPIELEVDDHE